MTLGVLPPPELNDGFRRFVQPIRVGQKGDQLDGAEKLHRICPGPAQRPQLARADKNCDSREPDHFGAFVNVSVLIFLRVG